VLYLMFFFYLSLFDVGDDSRKNPFEKEEMMRSKQH
jgi:hypothetical protein